MIYENDLFQPLNESIVLDGIKPLVLMVRGSRTHAFNCWMKESYLIVVDVRWQTIQFIDTEAASLSSDLIVSYLLHVSQE